MTAARQAIHLVDPGCLDRLRGCPIGPALLDVLGDLNADVREALAGERARLRGRGYPDDFPLPALWWTPHAARA
jgi:hypothetical protein